jgi:hypothetical protein
MQDGNWLGAEEKGMDPLNTRDVVRILMGSAFYFDLNLEERHSLIKHILDISSSEPGERRKFIRWL